MRVFALRVRLVARAVAALGFGLAAAGMADAGHEITFYPSFYPQQVTLKVVDTAAAARGLEKSELQAYLGVDPFAGRTPPEHVRYVESLGGAVTLAFDPARPAFRDAAARCAAGAAVREALAAARVSGFVTSAYPVTPFHPDWLVHHDLAQGALAGTTPGVAPERGIVGTPDPRLAGASRIRVKAPSRFTEALAKGGVT